MSSDGPTPTFSLNTATKGPAAAEAFFQALGFKVLADWGDAKFKALLLPPPNENLCLMLHDHSRFKEFIRPNTEISDARTSTEVVFSIGLKAREDVDQWLAKAKEAGATLDPYVSPNNAKDMGTYSRSFTDLDGHIWKLISEAA
ncbi:uncharacterized protein CTRU02_210081 [Colletotrichum truncatum]|uniref:Uncharacterized protein n=1 Tax=Colletotrichum truncatum TaxID=5467 RepID=A0ACC3YUB4_COLTU